VRILPAFGLALLACGAADRRPSSAVTDASPAESPSGSLRRAGLDAIVLRLPRKGGAARAYLYPRLDSVIWSSGKSVPAVERTLAFDDETGSLAFIDAKGAPGRLDLHLGTVSIVTRTKLSDVASADGYAIYGIGAKGDVIRLIPTGSWSFKPPTPASELIPMPDGTLIVIAERDSGAVVWRLRPPDVRIADSTRLTGAGTAFASPVGDRLYIVQGATVGGLRSRDVAPFRPVKFDGPVQSVALTPSGDRLFVALEGVPQIVVFDRYEERVTATIRLPFPIVELRMDSLGRTVLGRAAEGDSVSVIAVGAERMEGVVHSAWRPDLPFVAPDGAIAVDVGDDVVLLDGTTLKKRATIEGGALDLWRVVSWNGFRPRAA
jgi:hypothetical protein